MRLTESYLRSIIKQELRNALSEAPMDPSTLAARKTNAAWRARKAEQQKIIDQYAAEDAAVAARQRAGNYTVQDPGSGEMRRYKLGAHLFRLVDLAAQTYPKLMAFAEQSDPDFMDKFEQNLARIQDNASWSGGSVPADEHIIRAIEASLG